MLVQYTVGVMSHYTVVVTLVQCTVDVIWDHYIVEGIPAPYTVVVTSGRYTAQENAILPRHMVGVRQDLCIVSEIQVHSTMQETQDQYIVEEILPLSTVVVI